MGLTRNLLPTPQEIFEAPHYVGFAGRISSHDMSQIGAE